MRILFDSTERVSQRMNSCHLKVVSYEMLMSQIIVQMFSDLNLELDIFSS